MARAAPRCSAPSASAPFGFSVLWIKDESGNPTRSFKARGLSAAVSKAKELGYTRIARAGRECHVFLPEDTPRVFVLECERYPISSISSNAFHIPMRPVPPPVG